MIKKKIRSFNDSDAKNDPISSNQNKVKLNMVNLTFASPNQRRENIRVRSPLSSDKRKATKINSRRLLCFSPKLRNNIKLESIHQELSMNISSIENKEFTLPKIKSIRGTKTSEKVKELVLTP